MIHTEIKESLRGKLNNAIAEVFYSITFVTRDKTQTDSTIFLGTGIFSNFYSALLEMME